MVGFGQQDIALGFPEIGDGVGGAGDGFHEGALGEIALGERRGGHPGSVQAEDGGQAFEGRS